MSLLQIACGDAFGTEGSGEEEEEEEEHAFDFGTLTHLLVNYYPFLVHSFHDLGVLGDFLTLKARSYIQNVLPNDGSNIRRF